MRSRMKVLAACLLLVGLASAQLTQEWVSTYNGPYVPGSHQGRCVVTDAEGYVYSAGTGNGPTPSRYTDYITIKYDPATGETLWVRFYNSPGGWYDQANAIAVDDDGNVYVTGQSFGGFVNSSHTWDYATVKYDADGNQIWVARYTGPTGLHDHANAIAVDNAGGVYITGQSDYLGSNSGGDYATIKYNASDGGRAWLGSSAPYVVDGVARYDGPGHDLDVALDIAVDNAGGVYVTGQAYVGLPGNYDAATIKYNASDGGRAWDVQNPPEYVADGVARFSGRPWTYDYDRGDAIAVDNAGGVYVAGYVTGPSYTRDMLMLKYNASDGGRAWDVSDPPEYVVDGAARYNGPGNGSDQAWAIDLDNLGGVYVTGQSRGQSTMGDYATLKCNASDGGRTWDVSDPPDNVVDGVARYDGPANGTDLGWTIAVDNAGGLYVSGYSTGSGTDFDYATIKYNASDGGTVWSGPSIHNGAARYNGTGNGYDRLFRMAVSSDGGVYVTGYSPGHGTDADHTTVKYNASDGGECWAARWNVSRSDDRGQRVACGADGYVYACGYGPGPSETQDFMTLKYDPATGETLWVRYYDGGSVDNAYAIAVGDDGNVYVAGCCTGPSASLDYATVKYDASGNKQWDVWYDGPGSGEDRVTAIALDNAGGVYVTGYWTGSGTGFDYATIKYSSSGVQQWVAWYDGPGSGQDRAASVAVDNAGGVYVTGYSFGGSGTSYDYATIKYNSSDGGFGWPLLTNGVVRYNGPSSTPDQATAVVVDNAGGVYVTGNSAGSGTGYDYATIKYTASDGGTVWSGPTVHNGAARYNRPGNYRDYATAIALDFAGGVYVTGYSDGAGSGYDYATVKYNVTDGGIGWPLLTGGAARYDGTGHGSDQAQAMAVDASGVHVTGIGTGTDSKTDYATVQYSLDDGEELGVARYNGTANSDDGALSIAAGPVGNIYVAGYCNNWLTWNDIVTIKYTSGTADVGVAEILEPSGLIDTLKEIPSVLVRNHGTRRVSFKVWYEIKDPTGAVRYLESVDVIDLPGETELTCSNYPVWDVPNDLEGLYTARAWTVLPGDIGPTNDQATLTFGVEAAPQAPAQWTSWPAVPAGPDKRVVQHGACAATDPEGRYLYLLKGNNTCEFYRYDPASMAWTTLEPIPERGRDNASRAVKEGGTLAQVGGKFYATKGGNSTEFWEYNPVAGQGSQWTQMADVPAGTHSGASACGVSVLSSRYVYLLRASNTFEFYRYSVAGNTWEARATAPGIPGEEFKLGSSITYDGSDTIFVLKGILNRFYAYAVSTNVWSAKPDLPFGPKNKQAKGGAAICYHLRKVYCIKGSNSQEFWIYDCNTSAWVQDGDLPLGGDKTRVQDGGTLVYCKLSRYLYATKGGTLELWSYGKLSNIGVQSDEVVALDGAVKHFSLAVGPSVTSSRARVRYAIPKAGNVSLKLYEVTGRCAAVLHDGWCEPGRYVADVEARSLAQGIYLLKCETADNRETQKLVIQH